MASPFVCAAPLLLLSLPRLRICGCAWFADAAPLLLKNCSGRGLFQGCAAKKGRVASLFAVLGLSAFVGARGCGGGVSPRTTEKKILSRPCSCLVRLRRSLDKISFLWALKIASPLPPAAQAPRLRPAPLRSRGSGGASAAYNALLPREQKNVISASINQSIIKNNVYVPRAFPRLRCAASVR